MQPHSWIVIAGLALSTVSLVPTSSALYCAGYGAGGDLAEACNEAIGTAHDTIHAVEDAVDDVADKVNRAVDRAEALAGQIVSCLLDASQVAFYCYHNL